MLRSVQMQPDIALLIVGVWVCREGGRAPPAAAACCPALGRLLYSPKCHRVPPPSSLPPSPACLVPGVRSNLPTSEPGVTQRLVYSWTLRLQGEDAGPALHNCWLTESVQPISQNLFGGTP